MKGIHIFKAGQHTSSQGQTLRFSESDLKASVSAYNPSLHEAPIVIGHPKDNAPAWGWVSSLAFSDKGLTACPEQVDPQFEEMVQAGRFKKVSASFYAPDSTNNPVPGVYYLRHVGFLGAQPPAVKGLKDIEFADDDDLLEFSCTEELKTTDSGATMTEEELNKRQAALDAREKTLNERETSFSEMEQAVRIAEAAFKKKELESELETLVTRGKVLPAWRSQLAEFMTGLDAENDVVSFGEGAQQKKISQQAFMRAFLEQLPKTVDFGEHSRDDQQTPPANSNELAQQALDYQEEERKKGRTISITQAVYAVQQGQ